MTSLKDLLKRDGEPKGPLPKNLHVYVIIAIAFIVVIASWSSGEKAKKAPEAQPPSSPSPTQISNFQKMLKTQSTESERINDLIRQRQDQLKEPAGFASLSPMSPQVDPLEEKRREREASAPFASSIAIHSESPAKPEFDHKPQLVVETSSKENPKGDEQQPVLAKPQSQESGQLLPPREGDLYRLYEGTVIRTKLVNRLDGSFTGPVIAASIEAVASKDGTAVLLPKEAVFLGKATRVQENHQERLAVSFERIIFPNGYSVDLNAAPGLDRQGETGLKDKVNNHRARTFGISGAMGLLGGLALYAGNGGPFVSGVANQLGASATQTLSSLLNTVPTITIREGHPVSVYLPNDLLLPEYRPLHRGKQ